MSRDQEANQAVYDIQCLRWAGFYSRLDLTERQFFVGGFSFLIRVDWILFQVNPRETNKASIGRC
jgi:hypothetical protein